MKILENARMMLWFNEVRPIEFASCKPKQNNTQPRHAYKYFANQIVKEKMARKKYQTNISAVVSEIIMEYGIIKDHQVK